MKKLVTFGIVEDEWIEREAMSLYIQKNFPDTQIIFQEEDGAAALFSIHQNPPDILIVDIEMPVMGGLELCEHLYHEQYDGVILINTAYDKFAYAKRAIALKVFDYIVKPVDNEDLFDALKRCIEEAHRRFLTRKNHFHITQTLRNVQQYAFSLILQESDSSTAVSRFFEVIHSSLQERLQISILHFSCTVPFSADQMRTWETLSLQLLEDVFFVSSDYPSENTFTLILQPKHQLSHSCLCTLIWCSALLYLNVVPNTCVSLSNICEDCLSASKEFHAVVSMPEHIPDILSARIQMPQRTWKIIRKKEYEKYRSVLERYFRDQLHDSVKKTFFEISERYSFDSEDAFWETIPLFLDALTRVWNNVDFSALLISLFHQSAESDTLFTDTVFSEFIKSYQKQMLNFVQSLPQPNAGDSIDYVIQYMKHSFSQNITQTDIAEKLGLDSAYFSRLFKKRTGRNFSDVLMEIRMQHAEQMLLENPKYSLEELCKGCGLSSKTYFSEVFKKWKGITITQFLKNQTP